MNQEPSTTPSSSESPSSPKVVKKGPKKVVKKAAAKPAKKAANGAAAGTSLAAICKPLKVEPRWARRVLRNAGNKVPAAGDTRWTWTAAGDVAKVKKILEEAKQ